MDGVVMNEKLKGSEIHSVLKGLVTVRFEDAAHMGTVDFWPSSGMGCVFLPEADVINVTTAVRSKLLDLAKVSKRAGVVLAESTAVSEQYIDSLQQLATLEMNLVTLPVSTKADAARMLVQLGHASRCEVPRPPPHGPVEEDLLDAVQCLPKTGAVKARALLEKFGSFKAVSLATVEELVAVVGKSSGASIYKYFHEPFKTN